MKGLIQKVYYPQKKKKKVFQKCKSEEKKSGKKMISKMIFKNFSKTQKNLSFQAERPTTCPVNRSNHCTSL